MGMTTPSTDEACVDLEIRIFEHQDEGYPVEITLGGQQEFPRGYLAADVLPWVSSGDPVADGQRLFDALFADDALRSGVLHAHVDEGRLHAASGRIARPDVTFRLSAHDFFDVLAGRENADLLFMERRIEIDGDLSLALKMRKLFSR